MTTNNEPVDDPRLANDEPTSLGPQLAEIFKNRNIAVGADASGSVILIRPNTLVVDVASRPDYRSALASIVAEFDERQAEEIASGEGFGPVDIVTMRLPEQRTVVRGEEARWTLDGVNTWLPRLWDAKLTADYNYVVIGSQSMTGSPLGIPASWAGDMAFPGQITDKTATGATVMLTTAQPATAPPFLREPLAIAGHTPPRVLVLDTGLATVDGAGERVAHPELCSSKLHEPWSSKQGRDVADDEDEADVDGNGTLDFEAGHGTFISGIIRQICPDAEVYVAGALSSFGDGDVSGVIDAMRRSLRLVGEVDIVVMSFGGNLQNDVPGMFGQAVMSLLGGAVGVAAAGNQQTCRPYFPAALPDVIAVGALGADGKAWFTNFGGWVDACAPGIDVVSTFFNEFVEFVDGKETRRYEQWARWSGTSFSAPKVAAVIAQEMYLNQVSAKEAWKRVTSHKHLRYPDLGIVFNV